MANLTLRTPIDKLPMVGPTYAKRLNKLEIKTLEDLLTHYPHRHEDSSQIVNISQVKPGESQTIMGTVVSAKNVFTKRGKKLQKAISEERFEDAAMIRDKLKGKRDNE